MQKHVATCALALAILLTLTRCGGDEEPPPRASPGPDRRAWSANATFLVDGVRTAPADLEAVDLLYDVNLGRGEAAATAEIHWRARDSGYAYFLLDADAFATELDGEPVRISSRRDPDGMGTLQVIERRVKRGELHVTRLKFPPAPSRFSFRANGVGFLTSMSDFSRGNFFETYGPTGFENDPYHLRWRLRLHGAATAHRLYANGKVSAVSPQEWEVEFPGYFRSSSFYLHLTDQALPETSFTVKGTEREIPVTVYSANASDVAKAAEMLPGLFAELESTFGPYPHASFIAYIAGRGGMEHSGATVTSVGALGHELTHSWFARGVMPADGRSGWIDEAIASWRDFGYFRAASVGQRASTNLGRFSAFQRFTPANCYEDGRHLLSEIDLILAGRGGLLPVLKEFSLRWRYRSVHNDDFRALLEEATGSSLHDLFGRYVFGGDGGFTDGGFGTLSMPEGGTHPRPFTEDELAKLR